LLIRALFAILALVSRLLFLHIELCLLLVFLFILALARTAPSHFEDAFLRFFLLMIFLAIYLPKVDELLLHVVQLFGNIGQLYPREGNFIHVELLSDFRIVMTKNFTFGFGVV